MANFMIAEINQNYLVLPLYDLHTCWWLNVYGKFWQALVTGIGRTTPPLHFTSSSRFGGLGRPNQIAVIAGDRPAIKVLLSLRSRF
jgi:hypothetical protein